MSLSRRALCARLEVFSASAVNLLELAGSPSHQHLLHALHWVELTLRAWHSRHQSERGRETMPLERQRSIALQRALRTQSAHSDLPMQRLRARWRLELLDEQLLWLTVGAAIDRRIDDLLHQCARTAGRAHKFGQVPRNLASTLFGDGRSHELWAHNRLLFDRPLAAAGLLAISPDGRSLSASAYAVAMLAGVDIPGVHGPGVFAPGGDGALGSGGDRADESPMFRRYWVQRGRGEVTLDADQWSVFDHIVEREATRSVRRSDDARPAAICLIAGPAVTDNRNLAEVLATAAELPVVATSLAVHLGGDSGATIAHLESVVHRARRTRALLLVEHADWLLGNAQVVGQRRAALSLAALARYPGPVTLITDSAIEPDELAAHNLAHNLVDKLACHLRPMPAAG